MKKVLIISPRFPPVNAPDMHRVRQSLPYFEKMGWQTETWVVDSTYVNRDHDSLLEDTIPGSVKIRTVSALDTSWTRKLGLGSLALRSLPYYFWSVSQRLSQGDIDLVYFSTTAFPVMILGGYWKERYDVPYVIDMQDPWHTDYYLKKPKEERPPKFWFSYRLNKYLEPIAMRGVDGIISVSSGYCKMLRERYENIQRDCCEVIPFGATDIDFEVMEKNKVQQSFFDPAEDAIHIVYAGVVPSSMKTTIRSICTTLQQGLRRDPGLFGRVQLHFVGTSYAQDPDEQIMPIAREYGVDRHVNEHPSRIPYFQTLRMLRDADHLIVPGTDDPDYTASKLYPYILAKRPILAVFNERSSVVNILNSTGAGKAVTFGKRPNCDALADRIFKAWCDLLKSLPFTPETNWDAFQPYTAEAMTRRQVEVFNKVVTTK